MLLLVFVIHAVLSVPVNPSKAAAGFLLASGTSSSWIHPIVHRRPSSYLKSFSGYEQDFSGEFDKGKPKYQVGDDIETATGKLYLRNQEYLDTRINVRDGNSTTVQCMLDYWIQYQNLGTSHNVDWRLLGKGDTEEFMAMHLMFGSEVMVMLEMFAVGRGSDERQLIPSKLEIYQAAHRILEEREMVARLVDGLSNEANPDELDKESWQ